MYGRNLNDWVAADRVFTQAYAANPLDGEIVGSLVQIYRASGQGERAIPILTAWLDANPDDQNARQILESLE
jgi:thioredoxin-like negative regulator of GroEL